MSYHRRRRVLQEITEMLQPGDVVNFDSRGKWYMRFVFSQFRLAQKKKFGKHSRYRDIHSVLVMAFKEDGTPLVLSVTVPEAVIEPLSIGKRTIKITVSRLKGTEGGLSDQWLFTMRKAAMELVGRGYDYIQILAIKLKLQGWPKWFTRWLDLGKKRTVCSGGVQYCLLKAWEKFSEAWKEKPEDCVGGKSFVIYCPIPKPLGGVLPSETYPGHFVNRPKSFTIVKEWKL